ncbi:cytochrome c oxidase assembly protein COX16 homolog, mitochondrial [Agrilus planipennis]|uniref:Cytochrome c oxidase assembly protein COX16 homolog, mitochondrial n=1 Tax=Agrilus planipennis TaxID=224129 RepID=A0A7F5R458_AGRPL|nr:cytochrome c oxidase assembly protein COX16 homolog, mitochondrial [Agrilus planipennis]
MVQLVNKVLKVSKSKFMKYGVPFLIAIIGGSFGLKEFTQIKYDYAKVKPIDTGELKKLGVDMKKPGEVTLETEYEKIKDMDIDNWEQVRGPRPWEESVQN